MGIYPFLQLGTSCCICLSKVCGTLEGIESPDAVYAVDLLRSPSLAEDAENILVVGGGVVGRETSNSLQQESGKYVNIIEMHPCFIEGICTANRVT